MNKSTTLVVLFGLVQLSFSLSASAESMLELGGTPNDTSILSIGVAPEKKTIPLNLGGLRTKNAQLPAAPLTREQRNKLRADLALSRQRQVTRARRTRRSGQDYSKPVDLEGQTVDADFGLPIEQ